MLHETKSISDDEKMLETQGKIHAFPIYDEDVQTGEVYLYFDEKDRIVSVSLALDMPVVDEVGVYMILGFCWDDFFSDFVKEVIGRNKNLLDFVAFPKDYVTRHPELLDMGFMPMPFHEDFIYRPL